MNNVLNIVKPACTAIGKSVTKTCKVVGWTIAGTCTLFGLGCIFLAVNDQLAIKEGDDWMVIGEGVIKTKEIHCPYSKDDDNPD